MKNKNLLLGFGEKLTSNKEIKRGGGPKLKPYTIEDIQKALDAPIKEILTELDQVPDSAKPRGEGVFLLTLHPAFLSRSYYPSTLFKECGLKDLGSKAVNIQPKKAVNEKRQNKSQVTASIFVAGNDQNIKNFQDFLFDEDLLNKKIIDDLIEIENLEWFSKTDKLKGEFPVDNLEKKFEIVLHADKYDQDIIASFIEYVASVDMSVNPSKILYAGGLAFLPVIGTSESLRDLSEFTFLRAARVMPSLRMISPSLSRSIMKQPHQINYPNEGPIIQKNQAAIFDGGLGHTHLDKWSKEYTFSETGIAIPNLLTHGNEVTSTFLFGRLTHSQTELPRPYVGVDHFRVLGQSTSHDPDVFDVLLLIKKSIEEGDHKLVNLSLGPRIPIDDGEVHVWTSVLDQLFAERDILATTAVGNDGAIDGANRIQPPSDMVNALAVGAADRTSKDWKRAEYSCVGPGRSPGFVKPDGVSFGGSGQEDFLVFNPSSQNINQVCGTSFSAPNVLRTAAGLLAYTNHPLSAQALKALLIHHAESGHHKKEEVGWGRFIEDPMQLLQCSSDTVSIIFQGELTKNQFLRIPIPFPNQLIQHKTLELSATLSILAPTNPEHAINYTCAGMEVRFRPKPQIDNGTKTFFSRATQYSTEQESRDEGHKWETCLHHKQTFRISSLSDPVFDIEYHARDQSRTVSAGQKSDIKYAMVISIKIKNMANLYDLIRQRYTLLQPVNIRSEVGISV